MTDMLLRRRKEEHELEHQEIEQRLDEQEKELEEMAHSVRLLQVEAGLYQPQKEGN